MVGVTLGNNWDLVADVLDVKRDSLRRDGVIDRGELFAEHLMHPREAPDDRPPQPRLRLPHVYGVSTLDELDDLPDAFLAQSGATVVNLRPGTYTTPARVLSTRAKLRSRRA
jgi:hypothetical protein